MPQIRPDVSNLLANLSRAVDARQQPRALEALSTGAQLARLGDSSEIQPRPADDLVGPADRTRPGDRAIADALEAFEQRLDAIRGDLSASLSGGRLPGGQPIEDLQADLNALIADIDAAATGQSFEALPEITDVAGVRFKNLPEGVASASAWAPRASAGEPIEAEIEVLEAAEGASVSFEVNGTVDRGLNGYLELVVSDQDGGQVLSFASGTSLNSIRDAINTLFDGRIEASVTASGAVSLQGTEAGRNAFISIVGDPGDSGGGDEIAAFDQGEDVLASVNGREVRGVGGRLSVSGSTVPGVNSLDIELTPDARTNEGFTTTLRAEALDERPADEPLTTYLGRISEIGSDGPSSTSLQELAGSGLIELAESDQGRLFELLWFAESDLGRLARDARANARPVDLQPPSPDDAPTAQEIVADAAKNARTLGADGIDPSRVLDLLR